MESPTILIADDDIQMLKVLRLHLEHAGYTVTCARDSYQALESARRGKPDLLILDVNMPAGDGFSVQQRLQKMTDLAEIPIIYLTGENSHRVDSTSHCLGAFAVIHKPFEVDGLLEKVSAALSKERHAPTTKNSNFTTKVTAASLRENADW